MSQRRAKAARSQSSVSMVDLSQIRLGMRVVEDAETKKKEMRIVAGIPKKDLQSDMEYLEPSRDVTSDFEYLMYKLMVLNTKEVMEQLAVILAERIKIKQDHLVTPASTGAAKQLTDMIDQMRKEEGG